MTKSSKIDTFIEETIIILNNYLSENDRLCVLIYKNEHKVICPLMNRNKLDNEIISKDLIYYCKNNYYKTKNDYGKDEYDVNLNEFDEKDFEFNMESNYFNEYSDKDSLETIENEEKNYEKIKGLVKAINFMNNYSKMKEGVKNEKYIILFTDMLNIEFIDEEQIEKILNNIYGDKKTILLFVGKIKIVNIKNEKNNAVEINKKPEEIILRKFNEKSEVIYFENMKKIKSILSNNNVIKDEIIYPNEIYK